MKCPRCETKTHHYKINSYVTDDSKITGKPLDDLLITNWKCAFCDYEFTTHERRAIIGYDAR